MTQRQIMMMMMKVKSVTNRLVNQLSEITPTVGPTVIPTVGLTLTPTVDNRLLLGNFHLENSILGVSIWKIL
jgi:hypothetical protein